MQENSKSVDIEDLKKKIEKQVNEIKDSSESLYSEVNDVLIRSKVEKPPKQQRPFLEKGIMETK